MWSGVFMVEQVNKTKFLSKLTLHNEVERFIISFDFNTALKGYCFLVNTTLTFSIIFH